MENFRNEVEGAHKVKEYILLFTYIDSIMLCHSNLYNNPEIFESN